MSYIGKIPATGNFVKLDAISVVNGQASYTMQSGSVNFSPESVNHMLVSLNGVIQAPQSSFTISGSTITFASALSTGDVINFIMVYGNVLDIGTPSDDTISASKLQTDSVIEAKIQNDAVTRDKINAISTSSAPSFEAKGDGSSVEGKIQLNCHVNSHGVVLQSPPHSSGQSYTIKLPDNQIAVDKFIKVKSITGSGSTAVGQTEFADAGGGGGLTLVTRTAITSNVASVSFTNLEANNYHKFIFQGIDSTNNGGEDLCYQLSSDNGSSYHGGSDYKWSYFQHYSSGSTNHSSSAGDSKICFADGFHNSGTDEGLHGELTISNIGNGQRAFGWTQTSHKADASNKLRSTIGGGFLENGQTINAIQFFFDTGNISGSSYAFITHYKGVIA